MEVMPGGSSFITRAESVSRIVVQTSAVAAVIAACVLLAQPWIGLTAGATFAVTAAFARWRFEPTATVVLFFAYSSVGVLLAIGGSLGGAPLWLAAMAGLVAGGLPWRRWNAPP